MTMDRVLAVYRNLKERSNVYSLIKGLPIKLLYLDELDVPAKFLIYQNTAMIQIQNGLDHEEFYLLHEIGHYLLHREMISCCFNQNHQELEANLFACIFLIHGELIYPYYGQYLIDHGVPRKVIQVFEEYLYQYRHVLQYQDYWLCLEA